MTQESAPAESTEPATQADSKEPSSQADLPTAPPPAAAPGKGLPSWLPYFLFAVVPAVIVAIAVYAFAGGSSTPDRTAGIIDGFLRLGGPSSDNENINSFKAKMPDGFPGGFPTYAGSKIVASFAIDSDQGENYFVIYTSQDAPDKVYNYFLAGLDKSPWQVEVGRASNDFTAVRFTRPDNPDIEGDVTVHKSDLDGKTSIYVTMQDSSTAAKSQTPTKPFVLSPSRPLPAGFPSDIPIYAGDKSNSVVTDTYFERSSTNQNFYVSFLTKNSQGDVVAFYRGEFQKRGWTVTDSKTQATGFAVSIDFSDGDKQQLSGTVTADAFDSDSSYTKVDVLLQVAPNRGKGN